jgi:hypothetical protein
LLDSFEDARGRAEMVVKKAASCLPRTAFVGAPTTCTPRLAFSLR